ncbi:MAG: AAA family ATPase [Acholeplasma sp.]|nr:AAA family ATPase [Acholeplasma sp.]
MIIKSITINNFRQYKGNHVIEFSTDSEKNVTVILGVNTSGKTTIIQAFNWCLYNNTSFKSQEVLNLEVCKSMSVCSTQECFVEVILLHEQKEYFIRRTQSFYKNESKKIKASKPELNVQFKETTGGMQSIPKARGVEGEYDLHMKETINKILPESLSDYFFFDGERIADINNKGDVVDAVRGLMGLDVISTAMDRLDPSKVASVTSKLSKELDVGNDTKFNKLKVEVENAKEKLEGYKNRKVIIKEEIEFFERRKIELNELLLKNREVKANQTIKTNLERDINVVTGNIIKNENRLINDFSTKSMGYFALPLIKKALKTIDEAKQDGEGIPGMRASSIDHILNRGNCICGCDLTKNEGAKEKVLHEKSLLPPQHMGTILREYKKTYQRIEREAEGFDSVIKDDYVELRENKLLLEEKKEGLIDISKRIKNMIDVAKIEDDYQKNEIELRKKRDILLVVTGYISSLETEIVNNEKQIAGIAVVSEKNRKITKSIAYSKAVYQWFKQSYDKQEAEVKNRLLKSVNNIFEQMYHGTRKITINEKYQINLITMVGDEEMETEESKGLESVKNFSFIAGLVDMARIKARTTTGKENEDPNVIIGVDGELAITTEPYPLVMDAPFSNVDEIHINNIAKILPAVSEQVVLILMNKDWEFAKASLDDKVGCAYMIEKNNNSDVNSSIRRLL